MMKIDYLIDSKIELTPTTLCSYEWDIFVSCFNNTKRVRNVFDLVKAKEKTWVIIPEYEYKENEYPNEKYIIGNSFHEADIVPDTVGVLFDKYQHNIQDIRICIDITGFMRHHIIFLTKYLQSRKIMKYDLIYSEPDYYKNKADTDFTLSDIEDVRQIAGFEGEHNLESENDMLILGVGYDHQLMSHVIMHKENADLILLFSLPSLSADMYQESLLRFERIETNKQTSNSKIYFTSANDPFVIANTLSSIYKQISAKRRVSNIYLSPLATKPQALGFSLFYIKELQGKNASILFPFSSVYSKETSKGIGRIWLYPIYNE